MRQSTLLFAIPFLLAVTQLTSAQVVVTVGGQPLGVVSIGETDFVPCANGGQGEVIDLFGPEGFRWTYVTYSDGSVRGHVYTTINFKAVGETTGQTYQSKVTDLATINIPPGALSQTGHIAGNFVIAGNGISFHYHENVTYYFEFDPATGQLTLALYHGNIFLACH